MSDIMSIDQAICKIKIGQVPSIMETEIFKEKRTYEQ